jgi:hypothetical protein
MRIPSKQGKIPSTLQDMDYSSSTCTRESIPAVAGTARLLRGTFSRAGEEHNEFFLKSIKVAR